jgi:Family of unknown function (DUF5895)
MPSCEISPDWAIPNDRLKSIFVHLRKRQTAPMWELRPHWDRTSINPSISLKNWCFFGVFIPLGEYLLTNKYLTADYAATEISFGYVQALRGEADPNHCGYFIPLSQMEKSGWRNINSAELIEYTYNSGTSEVGILLKQPRMVLTAISQLGMFDRTASAKTESLVVVGNWNRDLKGNPDVGNFQVYLVVFLDEQNQLLTQVASYDRSSLKLRFVYTCDPEMRFIPDRLA